MADCIYEAPVAGPVRFPHTQTNTLTHSGSSLGIWTPERFVGYYLRSTVHHQQE